MTKTVVVDEALNDITKYIDATAIEAAMKDLADSKRLGVESQAKKYARMAARESDPYRALYYEYRQYLAPEQARILAREFYQKEWRSKTYAGLEGPAGEDDVEGDTASVLNLTSTYGNPAIESGMFQNIGTTAKETPDRIISTKDLFEKFIDHSGLSSDAKIVLFTRLFLGSGPGGTFRSTGKTAGMHGIDIHKIMKHVPREYSIVMAQMHDLEKAGIKYADITTTMVLEGTTVAPEHPGGETKKVPRLLNKWNIGKATEELQEKFKSLLKTGDMDDLKRLLESESRDEERFSSFDKVLSAVLLGGHVRTKDLIRAIVFAVMENIKLHTPLSHSKDFKGNLKSIATHFLHLAMSGKTTDMYAVQDLFLGPVFAKHSPLPLKKHS